MVEQNMIQSFGLITVVNLVGNLLSKNHFYTKVNPIIVQLYSYLITKLYKLPWKLPLIMLMRNK